MSSIKKFRIIKWKKDRPVLSAKSISKSYLTQDGIEKDRFRTSKRRNVRIVRFQWSWQKSTFMNISFRFAKKLIMEIFFLVQKKLHHCQYMKRAQMGIGFLPQQSSIFRGL